MDDLVENQVQLTFHYLLNLKSASEPFSISSWPDQTLAMISSAKSFNLRRNDKSFCWWRKDTTCSKVALCSKY